MAHGLRPGDGVEVMQAVGDPARVVGAHVILFRRGNVDAAMIDACPDLRLVQRLGERSDTIDLETLRVRGVPASCVSRASLARTAEHAILLMLALAKRLPDAERALRDGAYDAAKVVSPDKIAANWVGLPRVRGLHGRTLGIVGLGEVGTLVARLAAAFHMKILYTNRKPLPREREAELGVSFRSLDDLTAEADFVSVHAPNTPQTRGLISAGCPGTHETHRFSRQHGPRCAGRRGRALFRLAAWSHRRCRAGCARRGAEAEGRPVLCSTKRHPDTASGGRITTPPATGDRFDLRQYARRHRRFGFFPRSGDLIRAERQ